MTATLDEKLGYETLDFMIDIDDVIVPWFATVDRLCVERWDPDGLLGPCRSWSMHSHYGRTREEWEDVVIYAVATGLYTSVDPLPGSVEAINRLRWYGHRIHIVTARGFMQNGSQIREWTPQYLETFGIGYDTLTFAKDKVVAQDDLGLRFDYAIDDGLHNYEALAEAGVNVYLHDAPHNVGADVPPERRVSSLWEFANIALAETRYASFKPRFVAGTEAS